MQLHLPIKRNQSGFGVIEVLLIVFVVAALAVTGLLVYQHQKNTSTERSAATNSTQPTTPPKSTTSAQPQPTAYLTIKEWGIKVKLDDADNLTYTMNGTPNGTSANADGIVSYAALSFNDSVTASAKCKPLTTSISQHFATSNVGEGANMTTVGKYAYGIDGGPNSCDDNAISALQQKIFSQ